MNARSLLTLPLALAMSACNTPPGEPTIVEKTASSRSEAMQLCDEKVDAALSRTDTDRELFASNPKYYQRLRDEDFDKFLDSFKSIFFLSDEYRSVPILRGYCETSKDKKYTGYSHIIGYLEFINQPQDGLGEAEIERVIVPDARYFWKE
jgi:hypothetical protein